MTDRSSFPEITPQALPTDGIFFSVVIATFNRGDRIVPTIRSVLRQTWRDFEILVVGDGCTDNTGDVLATNFGDSVTWINLDRNYGSQSSPNNEGVRRARGSHIAYLGHDDIWSPDHLAAMARLIQATEPDFAVSGAILYPQRGIPEYGLTGLFDDPEAARQEFFPPSSWAHRRDVLEQIGPWGDPNELDRPIDLELQQRAVRAGLAFASTGIITVHKFAAISRYMSYRFQGRAHLDADLRRLRQRNQRN
ncbi:MAG: glycosyltransferase family 2 protein [Hyphomicrobiales bacterium]|nr:glycosyltransferase family 2 protein [Hyphomicrobiales bacterium]